MIQSNFSTEATSSNVRMHAQMYGFRSNCFEVTRKTAKSQTVDLEDNGQEHL